MEKRNEKTIKRVVLTGPESTGKTEIAEFISNKYNTVCVPEYARGYIQNLKREYTYNDIEHIAKKQIEFEQEYSKKANHILFYDTYLIITKVWFQEVYKKVPSWIDSKITESNIDLFLLCNTDIPWIADSVRENGGEMREKLFEIYKNELDYYGFNYKIINGNGYDRFNNAYNLVENFLSNNKSNF